MIFGTFEIVKIDLILTIRNEHVISDSKMSLCRRKIARFALGVPLEDDLWWVMRHKDECEECLEDIKSLRELAHEEPSMHCIDMAALVEIGHSNKSTPKENGHLVSCMRCARIGQYISTMSMRSETEIEVPPLSLTA